MSAFVTTHKYICDPSTPQIVSQYCELYQHHVWTPEHLLHLARRNKDLNFKAIGSKTQLFAMLLTYWIEFLNQVVCGVSGTQHQPLHGWFGVPETCHVNHIGYHLKTSKTVNNIDGRCKLFIRNPCIGWLPVAGAQLCFLIIKGPKQAYVRFTSKAGYTYMHKELKLFQWSSLADFKWIAYAIYSHNLIPILQFLQYQMNRIPDFSLYRHWNLTI